MENIAKIIYNEKEYFISTRVTIVGKGDEINEDRIYNGKMS